jgi:hypothetical protein
MCESTFLFFIWLLKKKRLVLPGLLVQKTLGDLQVPMRAPLSISCNEQRGQTDKVWVKQTEGFSYEDFRGGEALCAWKLPDK